VKAAEQPRFPSRADVEVRLRAQNPPPPVPSRETYRDLKELGYID